MRFKRITIENFKSIGPNPINVDLDFNKTTLLLGYNGAGKTTIFEAIVWCIYGVTKLKADNVVNKTVGENAKVELEFIENNKNYVITRYRKHKTHKNNVYIFENGNNISLKNQADTQELIQKIVGIDSRAFMSSIVLSSETYKQFLRETNSVRLQIFESVFSLRELNDFKKLTLQKIKSLENKFKEKDNELIITKNYNKSDMEALKAYKDKYNNIMSELDLKIEGYKQDIEECKKIIDSAEVVDFDEEMRKALDYQVKLKEFESKKNGLDALEKDLEYFRNEYKFLNVKVDLYKETLENYSVDELKVEVKKNSEYEALINKKNEFEKLIVEKKSDLQHKTNELKTITNRLSEYSRDRDNILKELKEIDSHICPVCGNHLEGKQAEEIERNYKTELERLDVLIQERITEKQIAEKEVEKLNGEVFGLTEQLNSLVIEKPKYSMIEIKAIAEKIKEATANIEPYRKRIEEKFAQIAETREKIKLYSLDELPEFDGHSVEWLNDNKDNLLKLHSKVEFLNKQIELAEEMKKTAFDKNYVQKLMDSIKSRNEVIERLGSETFSLRKDIAQYNVLDDIFSNGENGFKKYFINKTISMFNEKINTFLPFFFDDEIEILFDKNLDDTITFRGKETDFEELSSGEKTRAELCVIFSLYFMVQSLFGCGTNLLAVDELLDRGLDEKGIRAAKAILDDISKDASVFVVTHRDDLKELFSSILTVYKDGDGFTKIK